MFIYIYVLVVDVDSMFDRRLVEGDYICQHCGYHNQHKQNMQKHVETHIAGPGHICKYCSRKFKTTNSLNTHISNKHREERNQLSLVSKSVPY